MARFLIEFWKEHRDFEYHHVGRNYRKCGDYAKLSYWGLIKPRGDIPDSKKYSGYWRLTRLGLDFILTDATVQKSVKVYDSHVLGFEGPQISIVDALASKFDYGELMEHDTPSGYNFTDSQLSSR